MEPVARDKKEAFKRLTKSRLLQLQQDFKLIRNLGNPYNYTFTKEDLHAILAEVDKEVSLLKKTFHDAMAEPSGEKKGRPRKNRIPDSESTTTAAIAKEMGEEAAAQIKQEPKPVTLDSHIDELMLDVRSRNCLFNAEILTVREVVRMTERDVLNLDNCGKTSLENIKNRLSEHGFALGSAVDADETLAKGPVITTRPAAKAPTLTDEELNSVPEFLKKKAY